MTYTIETSTHFDKWFSKLKDVSARAKILARLARIENGNLGDHKQLGSNLYELRLFYGPGYRIYYAVKKGRIVLLMVGGDKSSQQKDISKAKALLEHLEE